MFTVTYEIVTPESAEHGDFEECGIVLDRARLRDAIDALFETRTCRCDGIQNAEAGDCWATIQNGMEFETGAYESRSFHWPDTITESSLERVLRLLDNRAGFKLSRV